MKVTATRTKVAVLLANAVSYQHFRELRKRPLGLEIQHLVSRIDTVLAAGSGDQVDIDQDDLSTIHRLSDALLRVKAGPLSVTLQVHCIASFLSVANPFLFLSPAAILMAPFVVPYLCLKVPVFGGHPMIVWATAQVAFLYSILIIPSYVIARDLRFREFSKWPYAVAAAVLIFWPPFFYLLAGIAREYWTP